MTGTYFWRWADNDMNHRFPVDRNSLCSFDMNDAVVPPAVRAGLKLRPRCHRIHAEEEFGGLVEALRRGVRPAPGNLGDNPHGLTDELKPFLPTAAEKIRHMRPHADLENLVEQVFRRVPGVRAVTRQRGSGDQGADLVVEFALGSIPELAQALLVQVRPAQGMLRVPAVVDDIRRAFGACDADMVLILSTAMTRDPALERELDRLREDTMKPVALLIGDELAAFLLRHGADLMLA